MVLREESKNNLKGKDGRASPLPRAGPRPYIRCQSPGPRGGSDSPPTLRPPPPSPQPPLPSTLPPSLSRNAAAARVQFPAGRVPLLPVRARPSAPSVPARRSNWKNGGGSCVGGPFPSAGRGESGRGGRRGLGRRHLPRGLPGALHLEAGRDGNARTVRPLCGKARGRAARGDSGACAARCAVGTGPVAISYHPLTLYPSQGSERAYDRLPKVNGAARSGRSSPRNARGRNRC